MIEHIDEQSLPRAVEELARRDADVARAVAEAGEPPLRRQPRGFPALLRIIVAQQVSVASAQAIWDRLAAAGLAEAPEPVLAHDEDSLRALGLSRPKARYVLALARSLIDRTFRPESLDALDDEAAITAVTALKGLGRWSAECYLLFSHGRPDVFPADDVGLMIGAQKLKGLTARPDAAALRALVEPWRPYRAVGARLLWHYRRSAVLPAPTPLAGAAPLPV